MLCLRHLRCQGSETVALSLYVAFRVCNGHTHIVGDCNPALAELGIPFADIVGGFPNSPGQVAQMRDTLIVAVEYVFVADGLLLRSWPPSEDCPGVLSLTFSA